MKTHIRFVLYKRLPKTIILDVFSTHTNIKFGQIKYLSTWRQYIFEPLCETIYSWDCLWEITEKIQELNEKRKEVT